MEVTLEKVFQLQDEVLAEHLSSSQILSTALDFISDCISLNIDILTSMQFEKVKQTALRCMAVDSLSHTIVAVRLGLWGDLPESLSLLRSAIGSNAQLQFVVKEKKYEIFIQELDRKFDQVSFEASVAGLRDLGKRIRKIHGRISETAAHSTARRLALVSYKYEDQFYDRVGFARNKDNAELALFYCMDSCLMPTEAFIWAYEQDDLAFNWSAKVNGLSGRFTAIRNDYSVKFGSSAK